MEFLSDGSLRKRKRKWQHVRHCILPQKSDWLIHNISTANQPVSLACGWSSAPSLGGGEEPQSKLYQELFRILPKHQSRIEYVVVGPPFDENKDIVRPAYEAQFTHLPKPFVAEIVDWIVQLGLIRTDGSGKPAFQTVRTEIQKYYSGAG